MELLSIVVPVFNEERVLEEFVREIFKQMTKLPVDLDFELIFVDDGSVDSSRDIIRSISERYDKIRLVSLSRNFGHQAALTAGLEAARGDAVVSIDSDLQDPPSVILDMVTAWRGGAGVVLGRRRSRDGETFFKLATANAFYRFMARISDIPMSRDVGDFRLLGREALDAILTLGEASPYYRGLVNWVGFNQVEVEYDRDARFAGESKYTLKKMLRLALSGLTSFTDKPLHLASTLGMFFTACSFIGGVAALVAKFVDPTRSVPGYATLLLVVLFLGGVQLLSVGVLGIYLGVVNQNTKARPRYVVWKSESINP